MNTMPLWNVTFLVSALGLERSMKMASKMGLTSAPTVHRMRLDQVAKFGDLELHPMGEDVKAIVPVRAMDKTDAERQAERRLNSILDILSFESKSALEIASKLEISLISGTIPPTPPRIIVGLEISGAPAGEVEKSELLFSKNIPLNVSSALRWYRKGILEDNLVDKFISHWIALEFIADKSISEHKKRIKKLMVSGLGVNEELFSRLYQLRCDIVHGDEIELNHVVMNTEELESILVRGLDREISGILSFGQL